MGNVNADSCNIKEYARNHTKCKIRNGQISNKEITIGDRDTVAAEINNMVYSNYPKK